MNYKHCCVIDTRKVYKTLVLVISRENTKPDGSVSLESEVQHYAMLPGETLIETAPPPMRFHAGPANHQAKVGQRSQFLGGSCRPE